MTPNFPDEELRCKCGCGMLPEADFMSKVQRLRDRYGKPLRPSSAARCGKHNASVSETGDSGPHTTGRAIDFLIDRKNAFELLTLALDSGDFTGIGVKQKGESRFLHLDDLPNSPGCPRPTIWSY